MTRRTGTRFFGPLPIFTGAYHPSAYKRGGGAAAGGVPHMNAGGNPLALDNPMQYANPMTKLSAMQLNDIATKGYGDAPDPSMVMMQNALKRAQGGNVSQQLADRFKRQNIGSNGIHPEHMPDYAQRPFNGPGNDQQGFTLQWITRLRLWRAGKRRFLADTGTTQGIRGARTVSQRRRCQDHTGMARQARTHQAAHGAWQRRSENPCPA
jgi:hypothetical protein